MREKCQVFLVQPCPPRVCTTLPCANVALSKTFPEQRKGVRDAVGIPGKHWETVTSPKPCLEQHSQLPLLHQRLLYLELTCFLQRDRGPAALSHPVTPILAHPIIPSCSKSSEWEAQMPPSPAMNFSTPLHLSWCKLSPQSPRSEGIP